MMGFFRSKDIRINVENEDEPIEEDPLPLDQGTELGINDVDVSSYQACYFPFCDMTTFNPDYLF